jgi:hypothetical protein
MIAIQSFTKNPLPTGFKACALENKDDMLHRDYIYQLGVDLSFEAQLVAVRGLLAKTKEADDAIAAEIDGLVVHMKSLADDDDAYQHAEWRWIDCLHQSNFHAAAHSMAALGMLAPVLESVFHQYFRAICQKLVESNQPPTGHPRWTDVSQRSYDCHWCWENNCFQKNLVSGVAQMADLLGLETYFPSDYKIVIEALFLYRNKMFHNGFEWPMKERRAFAGAIASSRFPADWFSKSTSGDDPVAFYMTDVLIDKAVSTIEGVLDGIGYFTRIRLAQ